MKKIDNKTVDKVLKYVLLFLAIIVAVQVHVHSGNMRFLEGEAYARGPIEMCDKMHGTMDSSGYCLVGEPTGEYRHYVNCTWAKIVITGDYEYETMNLDPRMWFTKCYRVSQEVNHYHEIKTYVIEG